MTLDNIYVRFSDVVVGFARDHNMRIFPFSEDAPAYVRLQRVSRGTEKGVRMERNLYLFADNDNFYVSGHLIKTRDDERYEKRSSSSRASLDPVSRLPTEDDLRTALERAYENLISLVPENAGRKVA